MRRATLLQLDIYFCTDKIYNRQHGCGSVFQEVEMSHLLQMKIFKALLYSLYLHVYS